MTVKTERSSNSAEILGCLVQFKSAELHGNIHLGQELVPSSVEQECLQSKESDKSCDVRHLLSPRKSDTQRTRGTVSPGRSFLGHNEGSSNPLRTTGLRKNADLHQTDPTSFLKRAAMHMGYRVSTRITMRNSIRP